MTYKYAKVILTGHVVEVYEMERVPESPHLAREVDKTESMMIDYEYSNLLNTKDEAKRKEILDKQRADFEAKFREEQREKKDRKEERRAQTLRDARNRLRRYALANFDTNDCFITLTYRENFQDVGKADEDYKAFIRKFKGYTGCEKDLKYLAVREFQKRGAIHYHFICNWKHPSRHVDDEEYIKRLERIVGDIWGHGFVDIKPLNKAKSKKKEYNGKPVDNIGAYLSKYMSKEYDDGRLKGKKAYLNSKGLEKPIELKGDDAMQLIETLKLNEKKETFTNSYESEYLGKITYKEYNMKRIEK